jgi:hypothetical protein
VFKKMLQEKYLNVIEGKYKQSWMEQYDTVMVSKSLNSRRIFE